MLISRLCPGAIGLRKLTGPISAGHRPQREGCPGAKGLRRRTRPISAGHRPQRKGCPGAIGRRRGTGPMSAGHFGEKKKNPAARDVSGVHAGHQGKNQCVCLKMRQSTAAANMVTIIITWIKPVFLSGMLSTGTGVMPCSWLYWS